jgi:AraC-like DNA-binding protein
MKRAEIKAEIGRGLERSCEGSKRERIVAAPGADGIERIEARFFGDAYARHRHDTYAVGLTLFGVQRFWYRGAERVSLPGQIIVLHPDEVHDGGAGDETGLSYRMLYVEPALIAEALDEAAAPPFVAEPVINDAPLAAVLAEALSALDAPLAEIAAATGFADQAHFTRHFKKAYGLPPGRWAALTAGSRLLSADANIAIARSRSQL